MEELYAIIGSALVALAAVIGAFVAQRRKANARVANAEAHHAVERAKHTAAVDAEVEVVDAASDELAERQAEVEEVDEITDPDAKSDAVADLLNKRGS